MSNRHDRPVESVRARWTAVAAGLAIIALATAVTAIRLPFAVWSAGTVTNLYAVSDGKPVLTVTGVTTYPTTGRLQVAGVAVTGQSISLLRGLSAFYSPDQAVMPASVDYPIGAPIPQVASGLDSQETQRAAEAAALQLAGLTVERAPRVVSVMASGPSYGLLLPDDVIETVGSTPVASVADLNQAIALHPVGDTIQLTVMRDGKRLDNQVDIVGGSSNAEQQTPSLGITTTDSYVLNGVEVQGAPTDIGSGLMLALAVYDMVTPDPLLGNLSVAGVGVIDANGTITGVAGASERLRAAQDAGVEVFLLPHSNCANVSLAGLTMTVVAVTSLSGAVASLEALAEGQTARQVPTCQA